VLLGRIKAEKTLENYYGQKMMVKEDSCGVFLVKYISKQGDKTVLTDIQKKTIIANVTQLPLTQKGKKSTYKTTITMNTSQLETLLEKIKQELIKKSSCSIL
jgi:hypothetical protein